MNYHAVIDFWFDEIDAVSWWRKDVGFDNLIKQRFTQVHSAGTQGELAYWRESAIGRLAEIIVLDQFSRNLYRYDARAFGNDVAALILAQEMIGQGLDKEVYPVMRAFVYMPFMHSESIIIHGQALSLFDQPGMEPNLEFERKHMAIIEQFGRYPHRNKVLGRSSTVEEQEFLRQPGSSF